MERSLTCLRCGTEMVSLGTRDFQLGRETVFFDSHLLEGALELEIYGCPSCGKIEFFSEKAQKWAAEYECPVCHAKYPRDAERCPKCFTKREKQRSVWNTGALGKRSPGRSIGTGRVPTR